MSAVISRIKYERLKLEGENVRAALPFRSIVEKSKRKEGEEKGQKEDGDASMKAELASSGSLLRLSFFPACELHKENMYTGDTTAFSELPYLLLKFLKPIGFFDVTLVLRAFHGESVYRNFLIIS